MSNSIQSKPKSEFSLSSTSPPDDVTSFCNSCTRLLDYPGRRPPPHPTVYPRLGVLPCFLTSKHFMTKITLCLRGWTFVITCVWFDTTPINTGFRHNSFLRVLKLICDLYCCPAPCPDHQCLCFIPRPRDFRTACNFCAIHNVFHLRFGALLCSNNIKRLVNSKLFSFADQFPLYRFVINIRD